jgi:hypothetical protein
LKSCMYGCVKDGEASVTSPFPFNTPLIKETLR